METLNKAAGTRGAVPRMESEQEKGKKEERCKRLKGKAVIIKESLEGRGWRVYNISLEETKLLHNTFEAVWVSDSQWIRKNPTRLHIKAAFNL